MFINGIGIVSGSGRGGDTVAAGLRQGCLAPSADKRVEEALLREAGRLRQARRSSRFDRLAVLAAHDALTDAGIRQMRDTGIILATGFGPHGATFRFLDDIFTYAEADVSPTLFSHSVHNAAVSYIALLNGIRGPTLTLTRFFFAFHEAVRLARSWLCLNRVSRVLLGAVDEYGEVMRHIMEQKRRLASGGELQPFSFSAAPCVLPAEAAVFFVAEKERTEHTYCSIEAAAYGKDTTRPADTMVLLDADGLNGDESAYRPMERADDLYSTVNLFGTTPAQSACSAAVSALLLKDAALQKEMHVSWCRSKTDAVKKKALCVRVDCGGRTGILEMNRMDG